MSAPRGLIVVSAAVDGRPDGFVVMRSDAKTNLEASPLAFLTIGQLEQAAREYRESCGRWLAGNP